jgi:hypothetical protein
LPAKFLPVGAPAPIDLHRPRTETRRARFDESPDLL